MSVKRKPKVLRRCRAVADELWGTPDKWKTARRLMQDGRLPHYREGNRYCVRVRTLERWIAEQEKCAVLGKKWDLQEALKVISEDDDDDER